MLDGMVAYAGPEEPLRSAVRRANLAETRLRRAESADKIDTLAANFHFPTFILDVHESDGSIWPRGWRRSKGRPRGGGVRVRFAIWSQRGRAVSSTLAAVSSTPQNTD
jgi:hypothetical protein